MRRSEASALLVAAVTVLAACGARSRSMSARAGRTLRVVTTTTQLSDFVRVVGGRRVHVEPVLKANVDPHDYEPTPADVAAIAGADVVVRNGIGLEAWFAKTVRAAAPRGRIVDASAGIPIRRGPGGRPDPHVWHDPTDAEIMIANIVDGLAAADPAHAPTYRANARAYDLQLTDLDAWIRAEIATLPNKKLVTNHDAFGYYVARYGLDYVGSVIPSFDSQAELASRELADLVATIRAQHVKAVFSEQSLPSKTAATVASEAGVTVVAGRDALYGDTLGPPGSDGDTYLKMERHNTGEIVDHLR